MSDFSSTKNTATFEEWAEQLELVAELNGGFIDDREEWREDYDDGKTPTDAWFDQFPE